MIWQRLEIVTGWVDYHLGRDRIYVRNDPNEPHIRVRISASVSASDRARFIRDYVGFSGKPIKFEFIL